MLCSGDDRTDSSIPEVAADQADDVVMSDYEEELANVVLPDDGFDDEEMEDADEHDNYEDPMEGEVEEVWENAREQPMEEAEEQGEDYFHLSHSELVIRCNVV